MSKIRQFLLYDFIDAISSDKGSTIQLLIALTILAAYVARWVI